MEYINAVIGGTEMYVPVNDKLGKLILQTHRRLNYEKHIAKMRRVYHGKIEQELVVMDSDFIYALEDTLDEQGYTDVIHRQFNKICKSQNIKVLYDLFREDKTFGYLIAEYGYEQEWLQNAIREFFESLKKIIF